MKPRFDVGDSVLLKDGRYRISAIITDRFESYEGIGRKQWHGFTYNLSLHGKNEGQKAEGVREDRLDTESGLAQRKADREFTKAFTPNKHVEYE